MGVFYPVACDPLSMAGHRDGVRRQPGAAHALGRAREHSGRRGGWRSRRAGAALAAFAWSTCGFFLIHLAHPWGYTTGCWMPWAWGLALVLPRVAGRVPESGAVSAEPGAGPPGLARTLSARVPDAVSASC